MSVKVWKDIRQKGLTKTENPCVGGSMEFIRRSSADAERRLISAHFIKGRLPSVPFLF